MPVPTINLEKLVARIALDVDLLHWFATRGGRKLAAIAAIELIRTGKGQHPVIDFLERHCRGEP